MVALILFLALLGPGEPRTDPEMLTADELLIVARTVWQEARGETREGKRAVVHVLNNRARHRNTDMAYEALRPKQFSGWNAGEVNRDKSRRQTWNDRSFRNAFAAVLEALDEIEEGRDPTHGARHYHANYVEPDWARGHKPVVIIGDHWFYEGIQ